MDTVLFGILAYILLQLLIGVLVSRRIASEEDYLLAGRSLSLPMATLSVFATWFGAETCIGAAGAVYEEGLSGATVDPFGYAMCLVMMGVVFSIPLWKRKLTTLADLFRQRYSSGIETLAVLLMAPGSIMWAAAQIRAFGQVLSATSGLELEMTIAAASLVVIIYTMYGGLMADVVTDAVQGIALIAGLALLLLLIGRASGGIAETAALIPPERLRFFGDPDRSSLEIVEQWAIPICGSVLSQELVARALAARSPGIARGACVYGGLLYLMIGLMPVYIGLAGHHLLPGLEHPEQILPSLAKEYMSTFFYIVFAGALISAILSTVDSALLAASSLLSHNLIVPRMQVTDESKKLSVARYVVMASGIVAYFLALHAERVYTLVEEASAFGTAGIFTVVIFGLFTRFGGVHSAAGSLIAGISVWIAAGYFLELKTPYLASLAAAIGAYVAIALLENGSSRIKRKKPLL
ncbi:MAG: sodium:solute symporter family protein [Gammaproteobacteria bacterium]